MCWTALDQENHKEHISEVGDFLPNLCGKAQAFWKLFTKVNPILKTLQKNVEISMYQVQSIQLDGFTYAFKLCAILGYFPISCLFHHRGIGLEGRCFP